MTRLDSEFRALRPVQQRQDAAYLAERAAIERGRSVDPNNPPAVTLDPAVQREAAMTFAYALMDIRPMKRGIKT